MNEFLGKEEEAMVAIRNDFMNPTRKKTGIPTKVVNIIRTTQRNNIDLTAIADNKANVLLSLNAIMLTAIAPFVIANKEMIIERYLHIPLIVLVVTCFCSIYLAAKVLKPSDFDNKRHGMTPNIKPSPFFFGNFYKMSSAEYYEYLREGLSNPDLIKAHLAQDMFYVGRRLGNKMNTIRKAFTIFTTGIFLTLVAVIAVLALA